MAAPSYTEDLTDLNAGAESTTGWSALGGGGAGLSADIDFAIQGTNAVTKQVTGAGTRKGMMYDYGSGYTMGANDHVFSWIYATCPGLLTTLAGGGMIVSIGTSTSNYNDYYVAGNDTFIKGGHFNWAVRYTTSTPSPGLQNGTPGASPQWFGGQLQVTGTLKAVNLSIDMSRIGTGGYITAGELISAGDASDNPCTFAGFAAQNDSSSNQWGICTEIPGGYGLQGRFVIGQNNSKVATLARFSDSDVAITLWDTPHSLTDFTQIIMDHASTRVEWTNINITALGTNNPGKVVVNSNNPTAVITGGTWTSIGTTQLRSNTTVDGTTWRGTDQITAGSATISNATFENITSTSHVLTASPADAAKISNSEFISDGTGNGLEITGTAANMTLTNVDFTGYSTTVDANKPIYVNIATGSMTISIVGGSGVSADTHVRTAGATITVTLNPVAQAVNVKDSDGVNIQNARVFLETAESVGSGKIFEAAVTSLSQSAGTATCTTTAAHGLATNDYVVIRGAQADGYNKVAQVTVSSTTVFTYTVDSGLGSPATGTPVVSYVPLYGLTDASGNITSSDSWGAVQGLKGWARKKNTSSPFYKDADIAYDVDTSNGNTTNVVLQPDE